MSETNRLEEGSVPAQAAAQTTQLAAGSAPVQAARLAGAGARPGGILTDAQKELLTYERKLLGALGAAITPLEPLADDLAALRQAGLDLDELFLLVVVGEFNSGKSAFINALLGERFLTEGVTPTTAQVTLLRYGDQPAERMLGDELVEREYPAAFLRDITIVDTPGTNAIIRQHEQLTRHFVPRADLVFFITSADRPFTESERAFLETVRGWGKKVIVLLNKIDLLGSREDLEKVLAFIRDSAKTLLGFTPEIYPVSGRMALQGKQAAAKNPADPAAQQLLAASRFPQLEKYIFETLDEEGRIRLKLLTPLGVAERVVEKYTLAARERLEVLAEDFRTTENIDAQLEVYKTDMQAQFTHRLSEIDNIIFEFRERGDAFFDEMVSLIHLRELLDKERIRGAFEREVVADSAQRIDKAVQGLIDWMVEHDLRLWQQVMEYVNRRQSVRGREDKLIGQVGTQFEYNRQALLGSVGAAAQRVVDGYNREAEALELAQEMRAAVGQTIGAAGLAGLGVIISIAITAAAVDITAVTATAVFGALAIFLIPIKRRQAKEAFHQKLQELRENLNRAMTTQFETELNRSVERLYDAIAPYTRFVKAENAKVGAAAKEIARLDEEFSALRARIGGPEQKVRT